MNEHGKGKGKGKGFEIGGVIASNDDAAAAFRQVLPLGGHEVVVSTARGGVDDEVEAVAAARVRNGSADIAENGAEALSSLGWSAGVTLHESGEAFMESLDRLRDRSPADSGYEAEIEEFARAEAYEDDPLRSQHREPSPEEIQAEIDAECGLEAQE